MNGHDLSSLTSKDLDETIALLEGGGFCWLRHSPILEARFEDSLSVHRSKRFLIEGIICVLLFNLFLIPDYFLFPQHFLHFFVVRIGFATPPALVALILLRRGVSAAVRESCVVVIGVTFALTILYLYFDISPVVSSYAVTDLSILLLFANVGIRARFPYAIVVSVLCVLFGAIYLVLDPMLKQPEKVESFAILFAAALLSVVGNYSIERGDRLNFLRRLESEVSFGELANANDELLLLARQDKLTGLANRGHFDETYRTIWYESIENGSILSVIMIDIDNFKALNDRYGHLYGDSVLQRVATLLKQALRGEEDFVARYGGEEFIVLLPNTSEEAGLIVAQRIRLLIEVAGSPAVPAVASHEHGWGTVSCGLATVHPRKGLSRNGLIAQADVALYQAKADGRNRVCVAETVKAER